MARTQSQKTDTTNWRGEIPIASSYTSGLGGQIFFKALKDNGELVGARCAPCKQVYVPARIFCERCFAELTDQVTVEPAGTLKSFSLCYVDHDGKRLKRPVAAALIQLEGATTVMLHRLLDVRDASSALIGRRVKAVIKPKSRRTGSILDIEGFRLID
ncbi:MAG: Zn-ribbon domain-containing OB-fold protein [Deltaproteobacteria bacterium]|nr:Zn-ribbon domain-containing OB-fold protein [Deltaproteobacteria bacterium]